MTIRDPYTGVERRAPPPRRVLERWWPAIVILAILLLAGIFEWRNAGSSRAPQSPSAPVAAPPASPAARHAAIPAAAAPQAPPDELARATTALDKAADQLSNEGNLMLAIAALQVIVLAGQLYLFGVQRRAARGGAHAPRQ